MYCKFSENKGWTLTVSRKSFSESGGLKEVIFMIKAEDAWTKLKFESGVHRVQRVPITEASGRIHTSTATVAVLPEAQEKLRSRLTPPIWKSMFVGQVVLVDRE